MIHSLVILIVLIPIMVPAPMHRHFWSVSKPRCQYQKFLCHPTLMPFSMSVYWNGTCILKSTNYLPWPHEPLCTSSGDKTPWNAGGRGHLEHFISLKLMKFKLAERDIFPKYSVSAQFLLLKCPVSVWACGVRVKSVFLSDTGEFYKWGGGGKKNWYSMSMSPI